MWEVDIILLVWIWTICITKVHLFCKTKQSHQVISIVNLVILIRLVFSKTNNLITRVYSLISNKTSSNYKTNNLIVYKEAKAHSNILSIQTHRVFSHMVNLIKQTNPWININSSLINNQIKWFKSRVYIKILRPIQT
jgi:hypothetical protein